MSTSIFLDPAVYIGSLIVAIIGLTATFVWLPGTRRSALLLRQAVKQFGVSNSAWLTVQGNLAGDYFDADLFLGRPEMIGVVLDWFESVLEEETAKGRRPDRLVFLERRDGPVGAVSLKDLLSWTAKIPAIIVRPERRGPASKLKGSRTGRTTADGPARSVSDLRAHGRPERALLISDVATTGTALSKAVSVLKHAGAVIDTALVLYDRREGGEEKLAEVGVRLISMEKAEKKTGKEGVGNSDTLSNPNAVDGGSRDGVS